MLYIDAAAALLDLRIATHTRFQQLRKACFETVTLLQTFMSLPLSLWGCVCMA